MWQVVIAGLIFAVGTIPPHLPRPARMPSADSLKITFLPADDSSELHLAADSGATLDVGRVTAMPGHVGMHISTDHGTTVRRRVAMRIDAFGTGLMRSARLRVALRHTVSGHLVKVNGVVLSTTPQTILMRAPLGHIVTCDLEITIPATAPAGPIFSTMTWQAESS